MPKAYCNCCRKDTYHKVVMKRCQKEKETAMQSVQSFIVGLFQGGHCVKMEKQGFCRVCNNRSELTETNFSNVRVI